MVSTPIPGWLALLDARAPYRDVLDDVVQPGVSPRWFHGRLAIRIGAQLDAWAGDRGSVGTEVRFYFERADGTWTSLLPDVDYTSYARLPAGMSDATQRPRVAPDLAVEILSPGDRPGRIQRKVDAYLEFGASLVVLLHPVERHVVLHRPGRGAESARACGVLALAPFDGLILDWDAIYRGIEIR